MLRKIIRHSNILELKTCNTIFKMAVNSFEGNLKKYGQKRPNNPYRLGPATKILKLGDKKG